MNPNKNRQRGKRVERALAKRLGGKRIGILGKTDISHAVFSFEVKGRTKFVAEKWFQQAVRNCEEGKIPAVIVHIAGQRHGNDYVIMKLKDFEDWLEIVNIRIPAPEPPPIGQLWLDTSVSPVLLRRWDGTNWIKVEER